MTMVRWVLRAASWLALIATALPAFAAPPEPGVDADIVAALGVRADVRSHSQACREQAPAQAWEFQWAEYFWESRNLAAFHAADAIVAGLPAEERADRQRRIDSSAFHIGLARKAVSAISLGGSDASGCRELARQIWDYAHGRDLLGDGVFQRLEAVYTARQGGAEAVRREVQHEDMIIGCSKNLLRAGTHDFEPLHATCACMIGAMTSSASPDELDAYVQSQSKPGGDKPAAMAALMKQPWMQQAIPKIRACPAPR